MQSSSKLEQISGQKFVRIVRQEFAALNTGLGSVSYSRISRQSGLSDRALSAVLDAKKPNPTSITMRAVLLTLGFQVEDPEGDVIPHLKTKGVYDEKLHGADRNRKPVQ